MKGPALPQVRPASFCADYGITDFCVFQDMEWKGSGGTGRLVWK